MRWIRYACQCLPVGPAFRFNQSTMQAIRIIQLVGLAFLLAIVGEASAADRRPNVLLILADDLGSVDLNCYGATDLVTPHLNALAAGGLRFTQFYAPAPVCSPSRAALLTGRYPQRAGVPGNVSSEAGKVGMPAAQVTIAEELKRAGYATAHIGKWHMGNDNSRRPGFDHWVCLEGQGTSFNPVMNVDGATVRSRGYVTDVLSERAVAFVKQARSKPFLLFFAHKAVHPETVQRADGSLSDPGASHFIPAPRHEKLYTGAKVRRRPNARTTPEGKPALARDLPGLPPLGPATGSSDQTILDRLRMLAAIDESTGDLLKALESTGQLDNTLVIFTSDNGGVGGYAREGITRAGEVTHNTPLRSGKGSLYEGGIRVPFIARWPRSVPAGSTTAIPGVHVDILPTFADLAGAPLPDQPLDGVSLVPVLKAPATAKLGRDAIHHHFPGYLESYVHDRGWRTTPVSVIREGNFKLLEFHEDDRIELYDLAADIGERADLATSRPEKALALRRKLAEWRISLDAAMPTRKK
ncbi:MAG TPA: aryl-sulfate sulfohydrolase [Verrucomicrobiales bacterium]|nr:aryl-sulfate sulfohydrolase [Verrucomicrobiales bacterium]